MTPGTGAAMMFALGSAMTLLAITLPVVFTLYVERREEQDSQNERIQRGGIGTDGKISTG